MKDTVSPIPETFGHVEHFVATDFMFGYAFYRTRNVLKAYHSEMIQVSWVG